jgi:undecaprenyl-diphosphatase
MSLFEHVNAFARDTPWLHAPVVAFAKYGIVLFAGLLLLSWWQARRRHDGGAMVAALWAPLGALLAIGLNQPLSTLVDRPRPFTVFPHALVLVTRSTDPTFPSDHAVMAGAVTAGVLLANRRLGLVTAALAVVMAFARVYVGAHFPADVVAGLAFGAFVTCVGYLVARRPLAWITTALADTPLRPLLVSAGSDA